MDAVHPGRRIIKELKPNNPRAIARGKKQLERYKKEMEATTGKKWKTKLDTYDP